MNITKGKINKAVKCVIYGPEGIGKSTFASKFPNALFIDTEGSTNHMDVARTDKPSSWTMILQQVQYVTEHPDICDTLIIDTIDWAEQLCVENICFNHHKKGIEDFGYGNGYIYVKEEFGRFLNKLGDLIDKGINVVLTAHAQMRKFEQPDELGAYDRWELKLGKKTSSQTSPLVKEWADLLLFANYKTYSIAVDDTGKKHKAQGGKRVMYTQHHPCWDAKNRHDLPEELDFNYEYISHCIPLKGSLNGITLKVDKGEENVNNIASTESNDNKTIVAEPVQVQASDVNEQLKGVPKDLSDLMITYGVKESEIQAAVASRGYYPIDTPIANYDSGFIKGVLVGAWNSMYKVIEQMKLANGEFATPSDQMEIPFNFNK